MIEAEKINSLKQLGGHRRYEPFGGWSAGRAEKGTIQISHQKKEKE